MLLPLLGGEEHSIVLGVCALVHCLSNFKTTFNPPLSKKSLFANAAAPPWRGGKLYSLRSL